MENKMRKQPSICPDCQQNPAVHHDGSGWFCEECRQYVDNITAVIEQNILERRAPQGNSEDNRRRRYRKWYKKNSHVKQLYSRAYSRCYDRGLRGSALQDAMKREGFTIKTR